MYDSRNETNEMSSLWPGMKESTNVTTIMHHVLCWLATYCSWLHIKTDWCIPRREHSLHFRQHIGSLYYGGLKLHGLIYTSLQDKNNMFK